MPKYNASAVYSADGRKHASKKEMRRYEQLKAAEAAGEIIGLECQKRFVLIPAQREPDIIGPQGGRRPGKLIERPLAYVADFCYYDAAGAYVVEDVKGFKTKEYIMKRKIMLYLKGIKIREV